MTSLAITLMIACALAICVLPLRWAPLPLLVGVCYIPLDEGIALGPFTFYAYRILIALGVARVIVSARGIPNLNRLDAWVIVWALVALATSLFHKDPGATLVNRLGMVYTAWGVYFLLRIFCTSVNDVVRLCLITALVLIPISLEMLFEVRTQRNLFSLVGGVPDWSEIRGGRVRAQGPFAHSILAGAVAATCLPLMAVLWKQHHKTALLGFAACCMMAYTSGSTGPVVGAVAGLLALVMWPWRGRMRLVRWAIVLCYLGLEIVMNAPAYYILTRIDVTGSSTSWHRAALIEAAITHLPEWWAYGTDYTRHWMAYGVGWSGNHIDITNQYLRMGVDGGLPLTLCFIAMLAKGFSLAGQSWRALEADPSLAEYRYVPWALGASLVAHAAEFIGISYFDQSVVFLYTTLAAIAACASTVAAPAAQPVRPLVEPALRHGLRH